MGFIRLNTVLKVPDRVADKAIWLSKQIALDNESLFVLDGVNFHPHITVYPPEYPETKIEEVLKAVKAVSEVNKQITLNFLRGTSKQGYIGVKFELSKELSQLHKALVSKLNPIREGHIRDEYERNNNDYNVEFTDEQRENIEKYGYLNAMSLYSPHMTIIRLKNEEKALEITNNLEWDINEFIVDKLAVYKTGENGTCRELLQEFNLKSGV